MCLFCHGSHKHSIPGSPPVHDPRQSRIESPSRLVYFEKVQNSNACQRESERIEPGAAFAFATATAVGQSLGARNIDRARMENFEANRLAVAVMAGMGVLFFFFPYLLLRAFTSDPEVIRLGSLFLKIVAVMQIPLAITMVLSGFLKGAGDTRLLILVTVAGMWVVRLPVAFVLALGLQVGIAFVWGMMVADWVVRMLVILARYRSERWQELGVVR